MAALTAKSIKPLPGYVLVEPAEAQKQTSSGIYLAPSNEEKPQLGTVLAVGADQITEHGTTIKAPVKAKDTVLYKKWGGNEVKLGSNQELQLLKFDDLIAVISE